MKDRVLPPHYPQIPCGGNKYLLIMLFALFVYLPLLAQFAGGTGTEADPYQVENATQLNNVRLYPSAYFVQTASINLGLPPWNQGNGWDPISFNGYYDGAQYRISNLFIDRPGSFYNGLFNGAGNIQNLILDDLFISGGTIGGIAANMTDGIIINCAVSGEMIGEGASSVIGGLVGNAFQSLLISGCNVDVQISGGEYCAALVAKINYGFGTRDIVDCSVSGAVSGTSAAGLVAYFDTGSIINCHSSCDIDGNVYTGALIGIGYLLNIRSSTASGTITNISNNGNQSSAGGLAAVLNGCNVWFSSANCQISMSGDSGNTAGALIGKLDGCPIDGSLIGSSVVSCFAGGIVSADFAGGLIGNVLSAFGSILISDSYSTALVQVQNNVGGGFVAHAWNPAGGICYLEIKFCYSTGEIQSSIANGGGFAGLIVENVDVSSCYWDMESSATSLAVVNGSENGIQGRTTMQMVYPTDANTYVNWDFDNVWMEDVSFSINSGYPYLRESPSQDQVSSVNISPPPGYYTQEIEVTLECDTENASIYYSMDGSDPDQSSTIYTNAFTISSTMVIKARAYKTDWIPSPISSAIYIFQTPVEEDQEQLFVPRFIIYPNPLNTHSTFTYETVRQGRTKLSLYNIKGQQIHTLVDKDEKAGEHSIVWDGTLPDGTRIAKGLYLCKLRYGKSIQVRKFLVWD